MAARRQLGSDAVPGTTPLDRRVQPRVVSSRAQLDFRGSRLTFPRFLKWADAEALLVIQRQRWKNCALVI